MNRYFCYTILVLSILGCRAIEAEDMADTFIGGGVSSNGGEFLWAVDKNCPHKDSRCVSVCIPFDNEHIFETTVTGGLKVETQVSAAFTVSVPIGIEREQNSNPYLRINFGEHREFRALYTISIYPSPELNIGDNKLSLFSSYGTDFQVSFSTVHDELMQLKTIDEPAIMTLCNLLSDKEK